MSAQTGTQTRTGTGTGAHTGTQAVDRAAELLALIVESGASRTFTSLTEETGLARSTASRLLHALERSRLVQRDRAGAFRPGTLFALYAARHNAVADLVELSTPVLERLGQATGETVNLAMPRGDHVVQVAQVDSRFLLGATNWVGVEVPAHCSALGKVFLAYSAIALPSGPLERRTEHTITTRAALEKDLALVVRNEYAVAREELEPGLVAIAAPIRTRDGSVIASISVSGPTTRLNEQIDQIGKMLAAETRALSGLLGFAARREGAA
jgi:IclR family acetate operon transcriptional repressor